MKSMKLTPAEAKEEVSYDSPSDTSDAPKYPYGLTICLDDEGLKKLGMDDLPEVGKTFLLEAKVTVCAKSQYENQGGADTSLSLQITDMELNASDSDGKASKPSPAEKIYGKK